jgi:hypothetical protein
MPCQETERLLQCQSSWGSRPFGVGLFPNVEWLSEGQRRWQRIPNGRQSDWLYRVGSLGLARPWLGLARPH